MTSKGTFLERALDAIDRRDPETIEGLRGRQVEDNIDGLLRTWRASLPWDAKDLFVHLLMDTRDARVERLMLDALESPAPETRAAAICYLRGNFHLHDEFHVAGGWIDPVRVDAAIAAWRNEVGIASKRECRRCGAPFRQNELSCRYCGGPLRAEAEDPGIFSVGLERYELRIGVPGPSGHPDELRIQAALKPGPVAVRFSALTGLLPARLRLDAAKRNGASMETVLSRDLAPRAGERIAYTTASITTQGEYEARVLSDQKLLASSLFRIIW